MNKGVIAAISALTGAAVGAAVTGKKIGEKSNARQQMSDKHLTLMLLFNQWMITKQEGKTITTFFTNNGYKKIAIYGMSYVGERVYDELKNSDIEVVYGIDKNADSLYSEIEILHVNDDLPEVDAVVVTPVFFFEEIREQLCEKMQCPIISFEDILYEI